MNKKALTKADIRTKFITPHIIGAEGSKWNVMTQLREEVYFTKGRVIVRGKIVKRGAASKALRSSLPFGSSGMAARHMISAGTM